MCFFSPEAFKLYQDKQEKLQKKKRSHPWFSQLNGNNYIHFEDVPLPDSFSPQLCDIWITIDFPDLPPYSVSKRFVYKIYITGNILYDGNNKSIGAFVRNGVFSFWTDDEYDDLLHFIDELGFLNSHMPRFVDKKRD